MRVGGRVKANTVRDICSARKTEFKRTVIILRAQIDSQIMEAASQGNINVLIEVPRHYIGREPYDWVQMGKALVETMIEDGYYISGTYIKFKVAWETPVSKRQQPTATRPPPLITIPSLKRQGRGT